jgi:hypothetical protein
MAPLAKTEEIGVTSAPLIVTLGVANVMNVPDGVTIPLETDGVTDPRPNATSAIWEPEDATTIAVLG